MNNENLIEEQIAKAAEMLNSMQHQELTALKFVPLAPSPKALFSSDAKPDEKVKIQKAVFRLHKFPSGIVRYVFSHIE